MIYKIAYTKAARRSLKKIGTIISKKIDNSIDELLKYYLGKGTITPDVKMLKGKYAGLYRLRTGKYRVLFKMEKDVCIILIIDVLQRKDAYK